MVTSSITEEALEVEELLDKLKGQIASVTVTSTETISDSGLFRVVLRLLVMVANLFLSVNSPVILSSNNNKLL